MGRVPSLEEHGQWLACGEPMPVPPAVLLDLRRSRRTMAEDQRPEGDWKRNVRERRPVDVQSLRPDAAGLRCLFEGGKCRLRSLKTFLEVVQLPHANDSVAAGGRQPRSIGALGAQSHHGDGGA